jgi:hypothetical protein
MWLDHLVPAMLSNDFVKKTFTQDFNVVFCLQYVDAIEFLESAKIMWWYSQLLANLMDKFQSNGWLSACDCKVINLL